eukprot:9460286-Pyramimonas_sp.AAC.1
MKFKISRNLRKTDSRSSHCPPGPGWPASCTPRRNSASSSIPKSSTGYFHTIKLGAPAINHQPCLPPGDS